MTYRILANTHPTIIEDQEVLIPFYVTQTFSDIADAQKIANSLLEAKVICSYRIVYSKSKKEVFSESDWLMTDIVVYTPKEYSHIPIYV